MYALPSLYAHPGTHLCERADTQSAQINRIAMAAGERKEIDLKCIAHRRRPPRRAAGGHVGRRRGHGWMVYGRDSIVYAPGDGCAEGAPVGVEERAQAAGVAEAGPVTAGVAEPCVEAAQKTGAASIRNMNSLSMANSIDSNPRSAMHHTCMRMHC